MSNENETIMDKVEDVVENVVEAVENAVDAVVEKVEEIVEDIKEAITGEAEVTEAPTDDANAAEVSETTDGAIF